MDAGTDTQLVGSAANGNRVLMRERSYSGGSGSAGQGARPGGLPGGVAVGLGGMPMGALGVPGGVGVPPQMGMPPTSAQVASMQQQQAAAQQRGGPAGVYASSGPPPGGPYNLMSAKGAPPMMASMVGGYGGGLENAREKETPAFDISDFPALANRPVPASGSGSSQQAPAAAEFHNDDFPALPSAAYSGKQPHQSGQLSQQQQQHLMHQGQQQQHHMGAPLMSSKAKTIVHAQPHGGMHAAITGAGGMHRGGSDVVTGSGSVAGALSAISGGTSSSSAGSREGVDRFGLLGLLSVIRMTDPDLNVLALGTDLTTLGLNLNSPEVLYPTFTSPWTDSNTARRFEPSENFYLPPCYFMQAPMQPPHLKIHLFSDVSAFLALSLFLLSFFFLFIVSLMNHV